MIPYGILMAQWTLTIFLVSQKFQVLQSTLITKVKGPLLKENYLRGANPVSGGRWQAPLWVPFEMWGDGYVGYGELDVSDCRHSLWGSYIQLRKGCI